MQLADGLTKYRRVHTAHVRRRMTEVCGLFDISLCFSSCFTKSISLDSVFVNICIRRCLKS